MKNNPKRALLFCCLLLVGMGRTVVCAQHKVVAYLELSSATPSAAVGYGLAGYGQFELSDRWAVTTGVRFANQYPSFFGDLRLGATAYLKKGSPVWSCTQMVGFSNYAPYPMNHLFYRITFGWQTKHFRVDLGNLFSFRVGADVVKANLFSPLISLRGNIFDRSKKYNIELFIRNFNYFEAHGSAAIEWGAALRARVAKKLDLFIEPYVVTTGNFSGTANWYTFRGHLGVHYTW